MKDIDYFVYKIKQLICLIFGHRLKASFKYVEPVHGHPGCKVKYYTCVRCGKRISINEFKAKGYKAVENIFDYRQVRKLVLKNQLKKISKRNVSN